MFKSFKIALVHLIFIHNTITSNAMSVMKTRSIMTVKNVNTLRQACNNSNKMMMMNRQLPIPTTSMSMMTSSTYMGQCSSRVIYGFTYNNYRYNRSIRSFTTILSSTNTKNTGDNNPIKIQTSQPKRNSLSTKTKTTTTTTKNTGGLRRLPVVKAPNELINRAIKTTKRECKADTAIKNARNRARKQATVALDTLTKELCTPLRDVVNGYKYEFNQLHSFEKVVADLTVKARQKKDGVSLLNVLNDINECRKEILIYGKDWIAKAKNAETAKEAMDTMVQGEKALTELFESLVSDPLKLLIDLQKSLRTTPAVRLDTPAVVLVGAPNVGKSSIVRSISSATPEVNNYPFTTRGMTLGHVEVFWKDDTTTAAAIIPEIDEIKKGRFQKDSSIGSGMTGSYAFSQLCQVMDSPGLLARSSDDKRNEMESLTLAAMQHLPTAVMYVMDLSGGAGDKCSSVQDQLQLRKEMRARFPRRPWIDVVSKYDLGLVEGAREELEQILDGAPYIELSIKEGTGVDQLRDEVMRMLGEVRVVLDAMAAVDTRSARPSSKKDVQ